jgi:hypothetical protein
MAVCSLLTLFFDSRIRMQNKVIRSGSQSNTDATKVIRFPIEAPPNHLETYKGFFNDWGKAFFTWLHVLCLAHIQPYYLNKKKHSKY